MNQQFYKPTKIHNLRCQRGAVALIIGLILLFLGTISTVYVTRTALTDQRISANSIRAKAAFEAADAGINFATTFMDVDNRDLNGNSTSDRIDMLTALAITDNDDMDDGTGLEFDDCDTNADNRCDSSETSGSGYRLQAIWDDRNREYVWSIPSSSGACDSAVSDNAVRICLSIKMADIINRVNVISVGYSDDGLAQKEITQDFRRIAPSPGNLNASHSLITYGSVGVSGSMSIVNVYSNATIWSGGDVTSFGGANSGTFIHPDPNGPTSYANGTTGYLVPFFDVNNNKNYDIGTDTLLLDYSANANSSTYRGSDLTQSSGNYDGSAMLGVDIIDNSSALQCDKTVNPDCFFNNFIAGPPDFAKMAADYVTTDDRLVDPSGEFAIPGSYIWVDARNSDGTLSDYGMKNEVYGTPDDPIILVIDGNFNPQGSWRMYGVLYVRGDVVGGGSGGGLLVGAMIVEGNNGVDNSGGMDIIYDPNVIGRSGGGNDRIAVAPISGTWGDWQ
ncbi:PilX N-terminal domain-containing pilus assembly protein [Allochromatium palmeri]|uniref:Type 4 fimbrial biogenesis protein PilX N-terminal domain-containing protein n=1 Tax=Allochromatium palmeri TaxID=231048 RepID=A0A6N8EFM0_9GAMM|nr:PilX N-terminal domain-containing pilus assembly protein [Allochromatium palmeri]MTW23112.1 hypothetical protein [Allochromatium palmeri]